MGDDGDDRQIREKLERENEALRREVSALRAEASRWRSTPYSLGDAIITIDADGRVLEMNRMAEILTGVRENDTKSRDITDVFRVVHEDTGVPLANPIRHVLDGGIAAAFSRHAALVAGGIWRPIAAHIAPIPGTGEVKGAVLVFRDETAERLAERRLRATEARLREAQAAAHIGSWELDHTKQSLWWSDEVYRMLELDPASRDPSYEALLERVHPDDRFDVDQTYTLSVRSGEPFEVEHRLQFADNRVKFVLERGRTFYDDKRKPLRSLGTMLDITGRKHVEEALRFHSELLEEVGRINKVGGWKRDLRTGETLWTEAVYQVFEIEPGDPARDAIFHGSFDEPSHTRIVQADGDARERHVAYDLEATITTRKGVKKWVRVIGRPVVEGGRVVRIWGSLQDITEQKRAEAELVQERMLLRMLVDTIPDLVWMKDPDGIYVACNRRFERLFGAKEAEIVGKRDHDFVDAELADFFRKNDLSAIAADGPHVNEEWLTFADDGHRELVQTIKAPVRDAAGKVLSVLGVARDITTARLAEDALRESEERYRLVVDSLDDVVFTLDLFDRITFVNRAITKFGFRREDVIGRSIDDFAHPEEVERGKERRESLLAGISNGPTEYRARDSSGKLRFVRTTLRVLQTRGRITGLMGVLVDLTLQRETEEQLRAVQKMEAVGRLAGGIAHDFNNLLCVIRSYTELGVEGLRAGDPLRDDLEEVAAAARRAEDLTRRLLAFSQRQVMQPKVVDLNALVSGLDRMLRRLIGEDIELFIERAPALGMTKADLGQIEQVLMNLVVNARDAMPDGGRLTIATANVDLDAARAGPLELSAGAYVEVAVADTGCGMDAATRARIFEPFFTTKGPGKGTGLGLAMVYGIVKQSGGGIAVESEPNRGALFRIFLPRGEAGAVASSSARPPQPRSPRGHETILVVEDEPVVRNLIRRVLEAAGYTVRTAANASGALLLCERSGADVDLVITDVVMPGMNGRELASRLAPLCPRAKVLFISGYADDVIERHGVLGPHFLPKPFDGQTLTQKVRTVLGA